MPDYNPYLHNYQYNWFLGINAMQYHADFYAWELFFVRYGAKFKHVIELGTGTAAFSLYLMLHCVNRAMTFETFDINMPNTFWNPVMKLVEMESHFHQMDIFADKCKRAIETFQHPMVLFCDNGHKISEVTYCAPYLWKGDFLAVHDWGSEFFEANVPQNARMILQEPCETILSRTRFWEIE